MPLHANLTGSDLHEPKGVASATANKVYVSDGAASGAWTPLMYTLNVSMADITVANSVYVPIPYAGTVKRVTSVISNAITAADETITVYNSAGVSMGTITVAYTISAAGDVDNLDPASNNTVTANSFIRLTANGDASTAASANFTIVIERS